MNRARSVFRDVWLVWLVLAVLTTAPYLLSWLRAPLGRVFTGVLTAYDDTFTYLAWMKQASRGQVLMCDLFTSEPQKCEFFLPLWSCLGLIARVTGAPIIAVFHAARLLAALLTLIVARAAAGCVIRSRRRVRYALWMLAFSGGLGWVVFALRNNGSLFRGGVTSGSIDLNLPEAIAFRSAFAQVHFSLGAALAGGAILLMLAAIVRKRISGAVAAGALTTVLAVVYPYSLLVVLAVAGAALVWPLRPAVGADRHSKRFVPALRIGGAFAAGAFPGIAYLFYLNRSSEVLREWLRITDTLSPSPEEYLLGFGVVGLLAAGGLAILWRGRKPYGKLLVIWLVAQSALLYAPVNFQRRLIEGLQLPLVIAASLAVFWLANKLRRRGAARSIVLASVVIFASLTNIAFLIGQVAGGDRVAGAEDPRRYISGELASSLDWLERNAEPDAVIFCSYFTGNLAPSITGLRVYLGHYGLTMNSGEKGERVTAFYRGEVPDADARKLLAEHRVKYVIYGPFERAISEHFEPPDWLTLAASFGGAQVFRVEAPVD